MTSLSLEREPAPKRASFQSDPISRKVTVLNTVAVVGVTITLAKLAALLKDLVVAKSFGTADDLDAFLVAFLIPSLASNVVAGSFNTALVPTYIKIRNSRGRAEASHLLSGMMTLNLSFLVLMSLLLSFSFRLLFPAIAHSFNADKAALTTSLFHFLIPSIVFTGAAATYAAILNAESSFALPTLRTGITPLLSLIGVLAFRSSYGIYSLAAATSLGLFVEVAVLAVFLWRQGISPMPGWCRVNSEVIEIVRQYGSAAAAALLLCGTNFIDQSMVSQAGSGAVASLSYGYKVASIILSVGTFAIGTAILPHFSELVARGDWGGVERTLRSWFKLLAIACLFLTAAMILSSDALVRLLYQRGRFTQEDTRLVSLVQQSYALQIAPVIIGTMIVRLISALRANSILLYGAVLTLALDICGNLTFIRIFGVCGVGLSNTVAYIGTFVFLAIMLRRVLSKRILSATGCRLSHS